MKPIHLSIYLLVLAGCGAPKKDTPPTDTSSLGAVAADQPAPTSLSFAEMTGFTLDPKTALTDTVNYFLLTSADDLRSKFNTTTDAARPDFLINQVVGVACNSTTNMTTILLDSARVNGSTVEIYLRVNRGEKQNSVSRPSGIFAIERRTDVIAMKFFVNGVADEELMLQ